MGVGRWSDDIPTEGPEIHRAHKGGDPPRPWEIHTPGYMSNCASSPRPYTSDKEALADIAECLLLARAFFLAMRI